MNQNDSDLVNSILRASGHTLAQTPEDADVVLLNTCAVRDKAEARIWGRLQLLQHARNEQGARHRVVGLLGCMAERLKDRLLDSGMVQLIAGVHVRFAEHVHSSADATSSA